MVEGDEGGGDGGGDGGGGDAGGGTPKGFVTKKRLGDETKLKRAAQRDLSILRTEHGEQQVALEGWKTKAATADTLATQLEAEKSARLIEQAGWDEERGIYRSGMTNPEGIAIARLLHNAMPEDTRGTLPEYLATFKTDPTKAPIGLQPYLPKPAAVDGDDGSNGAGTGGGAASGAAGTGGAAAAGGRVADKGAPGTQGQYTQARIREMNERARTTGDFSELKAAMPAIRAEIKRRQAGG